VERRAEIIVDIRHDHLDKTFTYRVPPELNVQTGSRVVVPFGGRRLQGYCADVQPLPPDWDPGAYKEVEELLDEEPLLTPELMACASWGARRWLCRRVDFLQAMVPAGVRWQSRKWVEAKAESCAQEPDAVRWLRENGPLTLAAWQKQFPAALRPAELRRLQESGIIMVSQRDADGVGRKSALAATLLAGNPQSPALGKKQEMALQILEKQGTVTLAELARVGISRATVRSLEEKGRVRVEPVMLRRDPLAGDLPEPDKEPSLTQAQARALQELSAGPAVMLLHGVTGSGKTEVYLQAIAAMISAGRGSIVLVPEIALTPQMTERFAQRFGRRVAVLHSRLSAGERYDEWCRIASGEALVAVGARSAVFAPFKNLGLIVLDEEHEASYKQDEAPRYHARDVALWRAGQHGASVILGSATPSLETYRAAQSGRYILCSLPERVENRPLPPVEIVDMRREMKEGHRSIFSRPLLAALQEAADTGKQAILLLNRRGFATFVLCRECGHVMRCAACHISLKFHKTDEALRCHYCQHSEPYPLCCPACGGRYIRHFGTGTQKVEEELKTFFPGLRPLRLDADTTSRKGAHQTILQTFRTGGADVLIGTQMVAKGLDFPRVTVVGVITADTALNLPDFRAGERTFQLLTQVAGRAGRGAFGGRVVVQTYTPEHYAVQAAAVHDYAAFYEQESVTRLELGYPPYSVLVRLLFGGREEGAVLDAASLMVSLLGDVDILGPSPCPIERIRGNYRWQLVARGPDLEPLVQSVQTAAEAFAKSPLSGTVRLTLDVEPQSLL
jgi:primosomal protein N' (replication factor Y) (superfamily II helicase)